jgi:hypothetical protein
VSPQEKKGYDIRDSLTKDMPEPLDLVCLAQLNEKPKDERALAQAREIQKVGNEPMVEAVQAMQNLAEKMANPVPAISMEQIQAMIDKGVAERMAQMK